MYKMFIDDERFPVTNDFVIVRNTSDAIDCVREHGIPTFVSFDHDLGGDDTSMRFLHMLAEYMMNEDKTLPAGFSYYIHSQNPVGRDNINAYMKNLIAHFSS